MRYIHKLFLMDHRVQTVFRAWSQSNPLITANFKISQFAISQHLSEFRASSLVRSERAAVEQVYSLTAGPLAEVFNWVSAYRTLFDPSGHAGLLWFLHKANPLIQRERPEAILMARMA